MTHHENDRSASESVLAESDARESVNSDVYASAESSDLDHDVMDRLAAADEAKGDNEDWTEFHTDRGEDFDCEKCGEPMDETDDGFFCSMCSEVYEDDGQPTEQQEWFDFNGGEEC